MTGPFADRLFRISFAAAGVYNLVFGLLAAVWPLSFFELFAIPAPRYPGIWACLGMVVGVYGLLYLYAARRLEAAWPIVAVGLLGKVLGPVGMMLSFDDDWPRRLGMLCVYNDLIWWLPFGLFLVRGNSIGRRITTLAPWLCVFSHSIAIIMLAMVLRHGGLSESDAAVRSQYLHAHLSAWTFGWITWMIAGATLVGFYAWWGSRLANHEVSIVAVVIATSGMVCDFSGESLLVLRIAERAAVDGTASTTFANVERAFTLLSGGAANGLYTLGGILLTLATPGLPLGVRLAMWGTWFAGLIMTLASIAGSVIALMVSTVALFPLLIAWIIWMGAGWRRA